MHEMAEAINEINHVLQAIKEADLNDAEEKIRTFIGEATTPWNL
jgi:hypothetical protein